MLVHTYFKEKGVYKIKMFLNIKAMFKDPVKIMEDIIEEYEKENNCSLGDSRELKLLNITSSSSSPRLEIATQLLSYIPF